MGSTLPGWAPEHMRNYSATDGANGHIWRGVPTLLLTTIGSKSGEERMLPLIYGEDDGDYVIVASKGGFAEHPAWYNNLIVQPKVQVQVAADKFSATAVAIDGARRQELWNMMAEVWPLYIEYQQKTDRHIPVVALVRD